MLVHIHSRIAICKLGKQTPVLEISEVKMACNRDSSASSADVNEVLSFLLSKYAKNLEGEVKMRYLDKIATIGRNRSCFDGGETLRAGLFATRGIN